MALLKKILIILLILIVLVIAANYGLSYYISKKLPSIIHAEKDFPYNVSYEDLAVDLLGGNLTMHNAYIAPKDSTATQLQQGAFAQIERIGINDFSLWQLLKNERIKVKTVIIEKPEVILYPRKEKYNTREDFVKPFKNTITTTRLEIRNGNFKMLDSLQNITLKASNINFDAFNIRVDSTTVEQDIPVRYRDYNFKCDSLFYSAGKFYNLTADKIMSSDSTLTVDNFKMIPLHSRKQFNSIIHEEKDQFNITAKQIEVPKVDWGFFRDTLYVHAPEVTLQTVNANIYRGKMVKDDPTRKKLYSELLRTLDFDLKVDKLLLKSTSILYEEQLEYSRPPAQVSFSKFYATVGNVYSPVHKDKLPNTTIDVQCLFLRKAPFTVHWEFNTLDTSDSFSIAGHLQNIDADDIDPITKPLMNATTKGKIKEVKFAFQGNRERAKGTFAIEYDDLKVDLYKKDGKKENKVLSAIGNLLVKNDTKDKLKKTDVEVNRAKDKSVFNFIWKFNEEGLMKSALPVTVAKIVEKRKEKKAEKKQKKKDKK